MSTILEVREIVSGYDSLEVLHGVSMEAEAEKITCIIGPNGAGKSTLLKTIFGFLHPKSGRIIFQGEDITGLKPNALLRRGLAYVPQGRSTFPLMSVEENLLMGAYCHKESRRMTRARIQEVYDRYPVLWERRNERAGSLSGGEQRMLEFGRTLLLEPKLLLLDEPSLGLSPKLTDDVYEKVVGLNEQGISIALVEQNVNKALEVSHKGYVLDLGRNRFEGSSDELLGTPELVRLYLGGSFD